MRDAWREYERDYARYFAGAIVYYALVSLIPILLLVLATLGLLLRVSAVAATAEQQGFVAVGHWLSGLFNAIPRLSDAVGWLLALLISFILATLTFGLLFMFLPPRPLSWRQVRLASVLCGVAWIIGAELLALYASFGETNPYGAIGGVFVVMLWVNYVTQTLFYGAEVCKVIATTPAGPRSR